MACDLGTDRRIGPVQRQRSSSGSGSNAAAVLNEARSQAIAPGDIPARADADEKFAQNVQRRVLASVAVSHHAASLAELAAALDRLSDFTDSTDLTQLSVQRLESLERHWAIHARTVDQARADLARDTAASSEDAADLAKRRAAWQATANEPYLSPALVQRSLELVEMLDRTQDLLAVPLGRLLELGRKGNALAVQAQDGLSDVVKQVAEQDRQLAVIDAPLFWQSMRADTPQEPVGIAMRRSLQIETGFARAHDAVHARLMIVLGVVALGLLPAMFWLKRRGRRLVAAGELSATRSRPSHGPGPPGCCWSPAWPCCMTCRAPTCASRR